MDYLNDKDLNQHSIHHENLSAFDEIWKTNEGKSIAHFAVDFERSMHLYLCPSAEASAAKAKLSSGV